MIDPSRRTKGLTPIADKEEDVYLGSVATNIDRFGFALLRARAKTISKAIKIAWLAMTNQLCATTNSAVIGCEKLPCNDGKRGGTTVVPFIEIMLLPEDEADEQPSGRCDGTLLAVREQGSTADGVVDVFRAVCRDGAERVVLRGSGAYCSSNTIRIATLVAERCLMEIDDQAVRVSQPEGGEKMLTGSALFGWDEGCAEAWLEVGLTPIFLVQEGPTLEPPARPATVIDIISDAPVDIRPMITTLASGAEVIFRTSAAGLPRALATAFQLKEMQFAHFPDSACVRREAVVGGSGGGREELILYVPVQPKSKCRQEGAMQTVQMETIQMGTQHLAEYVLALTHQVLLSGELLISSAACHPASSLRLVEKAVEVGIIHPPTAAKLGWTPKDGFRVQLPVSPRIVLP